jgi:hypothetical protein
MERNGSDQQFFPYSPYNERITIEQRMVRIKNEKITIINYKLSQTVEKFNE